MGLEEAMLSTHSLRKGGALWWKENGLEVEAIQWQGGWSCKTVMEQIYTKMRKEKRLDLMRSL